MVAQAFDVSKHEELARHIEQLSPDAAAFFVAKLEAALRKRKLQLLGYLIALVVWLVGTVFALAYYGVSDGFTGWVFLVPFALVGAILYAFGRWADKVGKVAEVPTAELISQSRARIEAEARPTSKGGKRPRSNGVGEATDSGVASKSETDAKAEL